MAEESKEKNKETIVLVHGTFAGNTSDTGTVWWQRGSNFGKALIALLGSKKSVQPYECAPEGEKLTILPWWMPKRTVSSESEIRPDGVFHWSGDNSEVSRIAAAELLLKNMEQYEKHGPYHIIGHSHGGSVLWEALRLATKRQPQQSRSEGKTVLPKLQSWTTLGTPFLHYRPELKSTVLYIIPLLIAGFVTWWTGRWVLDYWDHSTNSIHQNSWARSLLFIIAFVLTLFTLFILLRLIFALPRYALSRKRDETPAQVEREWRNLISCLLATVFIAPVIAVFYWFFSDIVIDTFRQNAMAPLINTIIWAAMSVTILSLLTYYVVMPIIYWGSRRQNRELHKLTWEAFCDRGLTFACEGVDEAINGLKAIEKPPRDSILPRIALSKASLFGTIEPSLVSPEREIAVQSKSGWASSYLVLPITFFIDWILRPAYNHIVAGIVDEYVRRQLHRAAHGCDIVGLAPHKVYSHPTEYFAEGGQALAPVNTKDVSDCLEKNANDAFAKLASEIRKQLSYNYPNGRFVGELLKESMQGAGCPLVHTSYYENDGVIEFTASRIAGDRVVSSPISRKQPVNAKKKLQSSVISVPTIWESSGYWITVICGFALLLLPPICLLMYSYLAFYEYSDDFHVAWAKDARPVLSVANDLTTSSLTENASQTPLWVRWWLAQHLHGQGINLQDFALQIEDKARRMRFFASVSEKMMYLNNVDTAIEAMRFALVEAEQTAPGSKEFMDYTSVIAKAFYFIKNMHLSPHFEKYISQLPKGQANGLFAKIQERVTDLEGESSINYFDAIPEHLTQMRKVVQRAIPVEEFVAYCTGIPNEVTAMQLFGGVLAHVDIPPSSLGQLIKGMESALQRYTDNLQRMDLNAKVKQVQLCTPKVISSCLAAVNRAQTEEERLRLLNVVDQLIREFELMVPMNQQSALFITAMKAKYVRTLFYGHSFGQIAQSMTAMRQKVKPIVTTDGKIIDEIIVNLQGSLGEYYQARKMSEFRSSRSRVCSMLGILENNINKRIRADPVASNKLRYLLAEDLYQ